MILLLLLMQWYFHCAADSWERASTHYRDALHHWFLNVLLKACFPGKGLRRKQELLQPGGKSCPVSTLLGKSARTSLSWDADKAELKHLYPIHPILPKHDKTYFSPAREDLRSRDLHKPKTDNKSAQLLLFQSHVRDLALWDVALFSHGTCFFISHVVRDIW